ncbi:MAG: hypothetical protein JNJ48_03610 [Phycisphaerae bacterium]|nr:hypothetical protein [Phycisphaerae bacterium]
MHTVTAPASLRALLTDLVDYAGLFPPAKLDMTSAVETYARHVRGPFAWGIARFVCPVSRLNEWAAAADRHLSALPSDDASAPPEPWKLTVLIDGKLSDNLQAIDRFNDAHAAGNGNGNGHAHKHAHNAVVDTIEMKVQTPDTIDQAMDLLPEELYPFFEIPADGDLRSFATCLAGMGAGVKIRTGGVTPELFPALERVADFLIAFHTAEVPFKATAGLHHPVRAVQPLTYEPGCATHTMHGFLNVFAGAALLRELRINRDTLLKVLGETDGGAFKFDDDGLTWRQLRLTTAQIKAARENYAICFGSCSYDDPINDLQKLGVL